MTTDKLLQVLSFLNGLRVKGNVIAAAGGEIRLEINEQLPNEEDHQWMLSKGFVFENYMYVYRP